MSTRNINQFNQYKYRTPLYTSNKSKQQKKKKYFNYPKNKSYIEETDVDSSPSRKENQSNNIDSNKKVNSSILYEDEYQGLTYTPIYQDMSNTSIYYYIEWEKNDDFNNFKSKWKTEICRYWEMYGECKYGENCAFAHGDSELKQRKMTFNYKTKPCKQFFELGYCSYGSRCQFSHKKEENLQKEKNIDDKENKVSYLKIIEELLSEDSQISHELLKRPRLMTFENITHCTLEESENTKLKLYEDIINLKNDKLKENNNISSKHSEDTNINSNLSSDAGNDKEEL